MTDTSTEARSVVIEREFPYPPEKIWRAPTQPHLIGERFIKNNFSAWLGQPFELHGDRGLVACRALGIEPSLDL